MTATASIASPLPRRLVAMDPTPKPLTRRVQAERRGSGGSVQSSSSAPLAPSISSSLHSHSNASISSSPPCSPTKSPRKTRLVRVRRNSLGMEVSRTVVTEDDTSNGVTAVAITVDKKATTGTSKVTSSSSHTTNTTGSNLSNKGGISADPGTVPLSPNKPSTNSTKNAPLYGLVTVTTTTDQAPGKPNNLQRHTNTTRRPGTATTRLPTLSSPLTTAKTKLSSSSSSPSPPPSSPPSSTSPLHSRGRVLHKPHVTVNQKLLGIASMEHDGTTCSATPVVVVVTPSPTSSTLATSVPSSPSTTTRRVAVPSAPPTTATAGKPVSTNNTKPVHPKSSSRSNSSAVSSADASLVVAISSTTPRLSPPVTPTAPHTTPTASVNVNATVRATSAGTVGTASLVRSRTGKENEPSTVTSPAMILQQQQQQMQQGERLVRIMLNESNARLTQETVDRTLQKHADLLRNQVQHKQLHKQELLALQCEQSQIVKDQAEQIANLQAELVKQKSLMSTTLEIKDVEYQLLVKERDQKAVKVQQLTWRLAKERTAGRDKSAAAAAAMAATSSLTDRAEHAEHELSAQQQTIHSLQQMVEHTVSALRGKDKFLRQLMDSQQRRRRCISGSGGSNGCSQCGCDPVDMDNDLTAPDGVVDDPTIDLSSLLEAVAKGSTSQARESMCCFPLESKLLQFQPNNRSRTSSAAEQDDDSSDATPLMGRSVSSGMSLTDKDWQTNNNDTVTEDSPGKKAVVRTESKDSIFSVPSAFHELEASLQIADLQFELETAKQQVVDAQEIIATYHQVQEKLKSEHDEVLSATKAKMSQIKSVLIACNERRLEAEERLRTLGQDVNTPHHETTLSKNPDVWNEIGASSKNGSGGVTGSNRSGTASSDPKELQQVQKKPTQRLVALEETLRQSELSARNAWSEVGTLQQALTQATSRADEAATSCQSATTKLSRVQAALDLSQAQVDSYGIMIQQQQKQQHDLTSTTMTMMDHHSSCSSFEEYVENVEQVESMAEKYEVERKATAAHVERLEAELVAKRDLLSEAESTIASLQQVQSSSLSAPCNRSSCRDATATVVAELATLQQELTLAHANLADAKQKLSYLRNTVLSVASMSSDEN